MKLSDFIADALEQIIDGVKRAQEDAAKAGAEVNPRGIVDPSKARLYLDDELGKRVVQSVEFDIAVTVGEDKQAKGGLGAFVSVFGLGIQAQSETKSSEVSRLKFSVPLLLPHQKNGYSPPVPSGPRTDR